MVADALGRHVAPQDPPVDAARAGKPADLGAVYEANFRYVWRCLRSLGVHDAQLDDALQDVFVVVQRKLPEFDGGAQLRTWLYAIALRISRKYRERWRREPASLESARESQPELVATYKYLKGPKTLQQLLPAKSWAKLVDLTRPLGLPR